MMVYIIAFRFRGGIKDLEVMMQNVITSAFDTVTTVECNKNQSSEIWDDRLLTNNVIIQ